MRNKQEIKKLPLSRKYGSFPVLTDTNAVKQKDSARLI